MEPDLILDRLNQIDHTDSEALKDLLLETVWVLHLLKQRLGELEIVVKRLPPNRKESFPMTEVDPTRSAAFLIFEDEDGDQTALRASLVKKIVDFGAGDCRRIYLMDSSTYIDTKTMFDGLCLQLGVYVPGVDHLRELIERAGVAARASGS